MSAQPISGVCASPLIHLPIREGVRLQSSEQTDGSAVIHPVITHGFRDDPSWDSACFDGVLLATWISGWVQCLFYKSSALVGEL